MEKKRVISGMRPSGKLHLGHMLGALTNWAEMQDHYDCFYFVADYHALTSEYANTSEIRNYIIDNVTDWLCCGIDAERATLFVQSWLPEHSELFLIFSMLISLSRLERVPTYKEQLQEVTTRDLSTFGFLGYPVLQAADILLYKGNFVPVGEDQLYHIELTREIARRFNNLYNCQVFPEPEPKLTRFPKLLGIDGRKMSKSYNNAINLSDPPGILKEKVMQMFTDPARKLRTDPGNPDICNVFSFHKLFSAADYLEEVNRRCRKAEIGCVEDKANLAERLIKFMEPYHQRRRIYEKDPSLVWDILKEGTKRAKIIASQTLAEVKSAIKMDY